MNKMLLELFKQKPKDMDKKAKMHNNYVEQKIYYVCGDHSIKDSIK